LDTYATVATWGSICLVLAKDIIHSWHSKQINFAMAYTQALVERDMYMEVPKGFEIEGDGDYVLQIHRISMAKSKNVASGTSIWWASSSPLNSANAKPRSVSSPEARQSMSCTWMTQS